MCISQVLSYGVGLVLSQNPPPRPHSQSWLQGTVASHLLSALVGITLLCQARDSRLLFMSLPPQMALCPTPFGLSYLERDVFLCSLRAQGNLG